MEDLRRNLWTRRERARIAAAALDEVQAADRSLEPVHVFCGAKRCTTRVATVFELPGPRSIFVSKIKEQPVDDLEWPPWFRDRMLAGLLDAAGAEDDELLWRTADEWLRAEPRRSEERQRWRVLGFSVHADVLTLPPGLGDGWQPALWVRCDEHPGGAQALDRTEVAAAARAARSTGRRQQLRCHPSPAGAQRSR